MLRSRCASSVLTEKTGSVGAAARIWATDGTADWLLWRIPELRGRIAYDVRFELYDKPTLERIVDYQARRGDWKSIVKDYRVVVVDDAAHLAAFRAEPGAKMLYRDDEVAVVERSARAR